MQLGVVIVRLDVTDRQLLKSSTFGEYLRTKYSTEHQYTK
jgi:hypothetical protein